jgi:hypothetical protein
MTFKRYFSKDFPKDLGALQLSPVPQVLKDIFHDQGLLCFGGKDWKNVAQDLESIAVHHRPRFVLSLLAMVLTDQCMQTYFKSSYATWRAQTNYPKFAWMRFGLYNENPLKLLAVPERAGLLPVGQTLALMPEFVSFYLELVADYLNKNMPQVTPEVFFQSVFKDGIMQLDDGVVLAAFKRALQQALQPAAAERPHMADWAMA